MFEPDSFMFKGQRFRLSGVHWDRKYKYCMCDAVADFSARPGIESASACIPTIYANIHNYKNQYLFAQVFEKHLIQITYRTP